MLGTALAVQDRYTDDLGSQLAAAIAFYGFLSFFPLLLLVLSVAGYVLVDDPATQRNLVTAVARSVPGLARTFRDTLDTLVSTRGPAGAVGLLGVAFAGLRIVNAAEVSTSRIYRRPVQAGAVTRKARAAGILVLLGALALLGVAVSGVGALAAGATGRAGFPRGVVWAAGVLGPLMSFGLDLVFFLVAYRLLSAGRGPAWPELWPGALLAAVGWTALKSFGALYAAAQADRATALYGTIGTVIGGMLLLLLAANIFVYGAELNALRGERAAGPAGGERTETAVTGPRGSPRPPRAAPRPGGGMTR